MGAGGGAQGDGGVLIALRSAGQAAPPDTAPAQLGRAIDKLSTFTFLRPWRRLISGSTGGDITQPQAIAEMLRAELFRAGLAVGAGSQAQKADRRVRDDSLLASAMTTTAEGPVGLSQTRRDPHVARVMCQ